MKNTRKGFTLVELLVVIAMLAILATVTVIGLTGCIEEAKLSVDQQGVEQMNTALEAASVTGAPKNFKEFDEILTGAGFNTDEGIRSLVDGYAIYWYKTHNVVILAKKDGTIVAPTQDAEMVADFEKDYESLNNLYDLAMCGSKFYVGETPYDSLQDAVEAGGTVNLVADVTLEADVYVRNNVIINLNGYTLDASNVNRALRVDGANIEIVINAEDSEIKMGKYGFISIPQTADGAKLTMNGGKYTGVLDYGSAIRVSGEAHADITLKNVDLTITEVDGFTNASFILDTKGGSADLVVDGGKYSATLGFVCGGKATITGATINTQGFAMEVQGEGSLVKNCNITVGNYANGDYPASCVSVSYGGSVTVQNSTLTANGGLETFVAPTGGTITIE